MGGLALLSLDQYSESIIIQQQTPGIADSPGAFFAGPRSVPHTPTPSTMASGHLSPSQSRPRTPTYPVPRPCSGSPCFPRLQLLLLRLWESSPPGGESDLHLRSEEARRPAQADYAGWRTWELKATNKPRAGLGWCGRPKNNPAPPTQRCPYPSLRTCDYISFHGKGD